MSKDGMAFGHLFKMSESDQAIDTPSGDTTFTRHGDQIISIGKKNSRLSIKPNIKENGEIVINFEQRATA